VDKDTTFRATEGQLKWLMNFEHHRMIEHKLYVNQPPSRV